MKFKLYFTVKGKQYIKTYNNMSDAEKDKHYVTQRGATNVDLRVCVERNNNENI